MAVSVKVNEVEPCCDLLSDKQKRTTVSSSGFYLQDFFFQNRSTQLNKFFLRSLLTEFQPTDLLDTHKEKRDFGNY